MSSDTPISDLIINKLSYNQYKEVICENTYNNEQIYEIKDISHTFNTHAGILSNCILEIPQNIKLTLENNVLTLKAGSILVNSGTRYSTRTITEDYSITIGWQEGRYVVINYGSSWFRSCLIQNTCSGSTDTLSSEPTHIWFDTTTQEVKSFQAGASSYTVFPYPICLIDIVDGVASFAKDSAGHDIIFNGACFIGHHVICYPSIKGLLSNELDESGNLKSIKRINNALRIVELNQRYNTIFLTNWSGYFTAHTYMGEVKSINDLLPNGCYYYVKNINSMCRIYQNSLQENIQITPFISYLYDGTIVTNFTIQQPFRVDKSKSFTYRQW